MRENIPLIVAGMIVLIGIGIGVKKGAIRIGVSLLTTIVTFLIVTFATPYVAEGIKKYSPMDEVIKEQTIEALLGGEEKQEVDLEGLQVPQELQVSTIQGLDIPQVFKILLLNDNNPETYQKLGVKTFGLYVGQYLSNLVIKIGAFLTTFLLTIILLRAIIFALNIISELPVVGFFNRLGGGVLGGIGGILVIWFLMLVITLVYVVGFSELPYQWIQSNVVLGLLYEHNPVLRLITLIK